MASEIRRDGKQVEALRKSDARAAKQSLDETERQSREEAIQSSDSWGQAAAKLQATYTDITAATLRRWGARNGTFPKQKPTSAMGATMGRANSAELALSKIQAVLEGMPENAPPMKAMFVLGRIGEILVAWTNEKGGAT